MPLTFAFDNTQFKQSHTHTHTSGNFPEVAQAKLEMKNYIMQVLLETKGVAPTRKFPAWREAAAIGFFQTQAFKSRETPEVFQLLRHETTHACIRRSSRSSGEVCEGEKRQDGRQLPQICDELQNEEAPNMPFEHGAENWGDS